MISGIMFIIIAWSVSSMPMWASICLTVWGSLCIMWSTLKVIVRFIKAGGEDY